jgi:amidohydrolase
VIPDEVKLEGTFRTMNEEWRSEAHVRMVRMAESIAEGMEENVISKLCAVIHSW